MLQSRRPRTTELLYDVSESYERALKQDRRERGEPEQGIRRAALDARIRMRNAPKKRVAAGLALIAVGAAGVALMKSRRSNA